MSSRPAAGYGRQDPGVSKLLHSFKGFIWDLGFRV